MRTLALIVLLLISLPVHAEAPSFTSRESWPLGCVMFCKGWMFHYGNGNADGFKTNDPSLHIFVYNKQQNPPNDKELWALNINDAHKIADQKVFGVK